MKEKKLLIVIITLAIVIILGIGGVVLAYMFTDILKTDKQLFFKYISKNEELIEQFNDEDLETYMKKQSDMAYSNEGKISLNVSGDATDQTLNMLKNASITFNGGVDKTNNYRYESIDVNYSDTEKINSEYIQLQDQYGLKINDVTNKFLTVENNNLKEWATKMGLSQEMVQYIPDKLEWTENSFENLFTKEELKEIKNKYLEVIEPELTDDMFLKNKENNSTIYTLTITETKLSNIFSKILTTLKNDELIMNKIKQVMLSNETITEESANEYIQKLKDTIQKSIDDLNNQNNIVAEDNTSTNIENNINIKVYAQKGKLEKTEISISNKSNKITITNIKNGIQVEVIEEDATPTVFAIEKIKNSEELTYNMVASEENKQIVSASMKYSGLNTEQVEEKIEVNYDMSNVSANQENSDLQSTTESTNESITITYEDTKKFDSNLQKQNITTSDMIVLNTAPSLETLTNLLTKVWQRLLEVNTQHLTKALSATALENNNTTTSEEFTDTSIDSTNSTNNNMSNTNASIESNNMNTNTNNITPNTNSENDIMTNTNIESQTNITNQITN